MRKHAIGKCAAGGNHAAAANLNAARIRASTRAAAANPRAERAPARAPTLKFIVKDSPCYIGLNKDEPKLLAAVNDIITKAKAKGDLGKLSETWMKAPLPPGF